MEAYVLQFFTRRRVWPSALGRYGVCEYIGMPKATEI